MPSLHPSTRLPAVSAADALALAGARVIDLRSPTEFAVDHLPGAINVPLFDDAERALIGTLYSRSSPAAAFDTGRGTVRGKIEELLRAIAVVADWSVPGVGLELLVDRLTAGGIEATEGRLTAEPCETVPLRPVVFTCWRGGLRSRSVVALLRGLGLDRALVLEGGYKAYRRLVRERIEAWRAPPAFVLRGLTGVGKTLLLHEIEALRPGWTLDLEGLAGHRSSILGMVGLEPCSQKTFDTRLCERLSQGFAGPCVIEGESRKVGDVVLPDSVWRALRGGTGLELVAPRARRVEVLLTEYLTHPRNRPEIAARLPFIEERLGSAKWGGRLVELLETGGEEELVALLLEHYYDPLYRHSEASHDYAERFDASDPRRASREVVAWIEARAMDAQPTGHSPPRKRSTAPKNRSGASSHGM